MDITLENLEIRQDDFALTADFAINGGCTAVIGPSGGGKSTLLLTIAGFIAPDRGRIFFDGVDFSNKQPAKRPVTLLFQENNLFPHLTVFQNTALGLHANLKLSSDEKDHVEAALDEVGLANMGKRIPSSLSGGQRQRVALARALLRDKPVLMLDEPFAALGPALRFEMLDLVAKIRSEHNATLLLVTHNPEDARRISDKTILVADGKAYEPQDTETLFGNPPPALSSYLGT